MSGNINAPPDDVRINIEPEVAPPDNDDAPSLIPLNEHDILSLSNPQLNGSLPQEVLEKIEQSKPILSKLPYIIPKEQYQHIYAIGDIHADLPKLITLLSDNGIIDFNMANLPDFRTHLHDINWIKPNTLIVLVGDIVDGRRVATDANPARGITKSWRDIPDNIGNIELLLHAFIYNIRLEALKHESDIRFVFGNHDHLSVLCANTVGDRAFIENTFYVDYVHTNAKTFFGSFNNRKNILTPFYNCSPYLIIKIDNEVAFLHAGFNNGNSDDVDDTQELIYQDMIKGSNDITTIINNIPRIVTYLFSSGGPVTSRGYYESTRDIVCKSLGKEKANTIDLTVVGHCITHQRPLKGYQATFLTLPQYTRDKCSYPGGHCVILGCMDHEGPHVAFTDVGLARGFAQYGDGTTPNLVRTEILRLEHTDEGGGGGGGGPIKYFNNIFRESTRYRINPAATSVAEVDIIEGPIRHETIQAWPLSDGDAMAGGRRKKNRRKTITKRKYKRRTQRKRR